MKVHCRSGVVRYIKDTQGIGSLLLFAVLISPVSAHSAAPPQQELVSRAQEHVDRGDALFDKRRYEQAIDEYTSALALAPTQTSCGTLDVRTKNFNMAKPLLL